MSKHLVSALPLRGLVVALALTGMQSAQAAPDDVIGRISWSLTDFQYRLVDLTPDDGATPWIRFTGDPGVELSGWKEVNGGGSAERTPGGFEGGEPLSYAYGDNITSSRQPDGWQAGIALHAGDVTTLPPLPNIPGFDGAYWRTTVKALSDMSRSSSYANWWFELSPNTQLVVEGKIQGETFVDLAPGNLPELTGTAPKYSRIDTVLHGDLQVSVIADNQYQSYGVYQMGVQGWADKNGWTQGVYNNGRYDYAYSLDADWAGGMFNRTNDVRTGSLRMDLYAAADLQGVRATASVPEPGALGLMLAGGAIAGTAARARRQRRQARA